MVLLRGAVSLRSSVSVLASTIAGASRTPPSAATVLTSGENNADATSYATASFTATSGKLILLALHLARGPNNIVFPATVTQGGLTYTLVPDASCANYRDPGATFNTGMAWYAAIGDGTTNTLSTGALGYTASGAMWAVIQVDDADVSGTAVAAIAQVIATAADEGTQIAGQAFYTLTFATAPASTSRIFGAWGLQVSTSSIDVESGYTQLAELNHSAPAENFHVNWNPTTADQTPSAKNNTASSLVSMGGVAIEVKGAPS